MKTFRFENGDVVFSDTGAGLEFVTDKNKLDQDLRIGLATVPTSRKIGAGIDDLVGKFDAYEIAPAIRSRATTMVNRMRSAYRADRAGYRTTYEKVKEVAQVTAGPGVDPTTVEFFVSFRAEDYTSQVNLTGTLGED